FDGATPAIVFHAILAKTPPSPRLANPDVPSELERIIGRLLEKDRDLRYRAAADVRSDLARLKREIALGRGHTEPAARARGRRPLVLAGGVAAVLLAAAAWFLAPTSRGSIESIAVLPFANLTGDPDTEYLGDGIA